MTFGTRTGIVIALIMVAASATAATMEGRIARVSGNVEIVTTEGEVRQAEAGAAIATGDMVVTRAGAQAVLEFNNGSLTVMGERSRLQVQTSKDDGWLSQLGGRIYYAFRKLAAQPKSLTPGTRTAYARQVRTPFATLGIRGTVFIVTLTDEDRGVALQEGRIEVASPEGEFEIHRKRQDRNFDSYKNESDKAARAIENEWQQHKRQLKEEFVEYQQSFSLEPEKVLRFDGKKVSEQLMDQKTRTQFGEFEKFAGELLQQYRAHQ